MIDGQITDEQVGAALRRAAAAIDADFNEETWQWYARAIVRDADALAEKRRQGKLQPIERSRFIVYPQDVIDGFLERLVEMVTGSASTCGWDRRGDRDQG